MNELQTQRLILRPWREDDLPAFAAMNANPEVMRHFPACMSLDESDALARRIIQHFADHGFGQWVVERAAQPGLIGVVGLQHVSFSAPFTPAVEIGWRLDSSHWRQGYALEAARAVLRQGFTELGLEQILAFTVPANRPSQALMQRLGMQHDRQGDFQHPRLPVGHALRRHVLYRLTREHWQQAHE
ncbi:GNAT family N-acetyltransferase [Pseudomonas segetis]|uniref:Protein N-acetyltransferase, RimJ/RimL family n=1 Tax=Pseudomonas segetis TaxID=298908 RepID=A0A239GZR4_9PSED|nr:GNAT family N-acetyltransferase [Pseudomonas segetis]SNS74278.1 Protein N-acetyltransferase, RimJ/RimL family [Pseudomonas segetis]